MSDMSITVIYHAVSDCTVGQIIAFWLAEISSLLGFLPKFLFLELQDGHHCKANLTWEPTVDISRLHVYSYLKLKYWTISSHGLLQDVCVCVEQKCKMGATIASLNKRTNIKMKKNTLSKIVGNRLNRNSTWIVIRLSFFVDRKCKFADITGHCFTMGMNSFWSINTKLKLVWSQTVYVPG